MEEETRRLLIYCPVCGSLIQKTARADTEIKCVQCRKILTILVEKNIVKIEIKDKLKLNPQK